MNIRLLLPACLLLLGTFAANAQEPFLPRITPRSQKFTADTISFTVKVAVEVGFTADVELIVTAPTLPGVLVSLAPGRLKSPYSDSVLVTIGLSARVPGRHPIVVEASNGPAVGRDTAFLEISEVHNKAWRLYTEPSYERNGYSTFLLDRKQGVGWCANTDRLMRFDGTTWTSYRWPFDSVKDMRLHGFAIDSSGDLWTMVFGNQALLVRKHGTTWTIFDGKDTSSGITTAMLNNLYTYEFLAPNGLQADGQGNIWALGQGTLLRYDGSRWREYSSKNSPLPLQEMFSHLTDRDGNVWISLGYEDITNNGRVILRFDGKYWTEFNREDLGLPSDGPPLAIPISVDRNGHLWLSSGGLIEDFDGNHGTIHGYDERWLGRGLPTFDRHNQPWILPYGEGVARFHDSTWWHYTISNSGLGNNYPYAIDIDDSDRAWIMGYDGLTILDGTILPRDAFIAGVENSPHVSESNVAMKIIPNPARGVSTVQFILPEREHVRLSVINSLGKEVGMMIDGVMEPGEHTARFDATALPGGAYFIRIATGTAVVTKPVVIVH